MTDSIFDSLDGTSPGGDSTPTPQPDMLAYANQQLASGINPDDAMKATFAKYPQASGAAFILSPDKKSFSDKSQDTIFNSYDTSGKLPAASVKESKGSIFSSLPEKKAPIQAPKLPDVVANDPMSKLASAIEPALVSTAAKVGTYFNNFSKLHQTTYKSFSPEQIAAAKAVGIPLPYHDMYKDPAHAGQVSVLDMGTDKYNELFDNAVRKAGEDPDVIRKTIEEGEKGNLSSANLASAISQHSLIAQGAKAFFNPSLANTKVYEETKKAADALATLKDPKASTEDKKKATYKLIVMKAQNGGFTDSLRAMYEQFRQDPMDAAKGMLFSMGETPELLAVGAGGDLGKIAYGAKAEQATALSGKLVDRAAQAIQKSRLAEVAGDPSAGAAQLAKANKIAQKALTLKKLQKIGDLVGSTGTGAAINTAASAASQYNEKGYTTGGQLGSAAITGAAFGAGAHLLHGGEPRTQENSHPAQTETAQTRQGAPGDINQPHQPGEPIPTNAPVDDTGTVPYTGGAADNLKKTHIDKNFPDTLTYKTREGQDVTLPVKDIVTQVHEAEEAPLMHPKGPVPVDKLVALVQRAGQYANKEVFSPSILKKINKGKPLSYPEAHEIATVIENNHVHNTYNVDPKVYQEQLKPFIKDIADRSEKEGKGDIPADLDTKPYDDMDHPEVVSGASKGAEGGSIFDSLMKGTQQGGRIDKRLLATGAAAGLGATAGAVMSPQGKKESGAIAGGLAGLFAGINMWGDSIPSRGLGNKERGMFAGPKSKGWNPRDVDMAERMEKIGKTPAQIQLATGMHREASGKWLREFSDEGIHFKGYPDPQEGERPLRDVIDHTTLEREYPNLVDNVKVRTTLKMPLLGGYEKKTNTIYLNPREIRRSNSTPESVIAHELMHAVQNVEDLPIGSNARREAEITDKHLNYLYDRNESIFQNLLQAERDGLNTDELEKAYKKTSVAIARRERDLDSYNYEKYLSQAGETQARNVQRRLGLTEEERREVPVTTTEDVPRSIQGIRFPDTSLQQHLQASGVMDVEGTLHGMDLPEDRLPEEVQTVEKAKSGDQRAIATLYNKYMPRLERTLRGMMREAGPRLGLGSEDIASQAFMKAIQSLPSFEGKSAFYTYLYQIARNEALNAIEKGNRQVPTSSMFRASSPGEGLPATQGGIEDVGGSPIRSDVEGKSASTSTPEEEAIARQASNMVQHTISKLPQDIKEAIKMKEFVGMSEQEIAEAQGVPLGTVKSRLSRGRDMIQQSIKGGHGANFRKQGGFASPEDLKKLAWAASMGTLGATLGANIAGQEQEGKGALVGAGLALALTPFIRDLTTHPIDTSRRVYQNLAENIVAPKREDVSDTIGRWQAQGKQAEIINYRTGNAINRMVPDKAGRVRVTHALDTGDASKLTPEELKAHTYARNLLDKMGQLALQNGVIKDVLQNYVTHIWKNDAAFKKYQQALGGQITAAMSAKTPFGLTRTIYSIAQGKALGLTPLTEDVTEILHHYTKSVLQAIRNKQLLSSLKGTKDSAGNSYLVMPAGKSPYNFVQINHPQLRGMSVHPTIAPEMRNMFYSYDLDAFQTAASTLNMALKRSQVSFSLFHLTSLMDAYLGGMPTFTHPIHTMGEAIKSTAGKSSYHAALNGTADPATQQLFDRSLQAGVQYQIPRGQGADVDFNNNYYAGLQHIQDWLDKVIPGAGNIALAASKVSHAFDHVIFENGMSGMKFSLWMHAVQQLNDGWAAKVKKDPNTVVPKQAEIDRIASGYVNNLLGSQNWLQAAQQATTKFGRAWLNMLGSPTGRKASQYMLFAPDWTTSTFMSFLKALGKGSGLGGFVHPKTVADLHRIYQVRSAALYALIGGGLNMAMSGHYLWDNKDPTTIDMGNGQRLQWNKHWTEPYQIFGGMLEGNFQPSYNKLGFLPHESIDQVMKKEYINLNGASPKMQEGRLAHFAKGVVPIPFQSFGDQTPEQLMWNIAGRNVLGHPQTGEAGRKWKEKMEQKRHEAAEKAARTRMNKIFGG